MAEKKKYSLTEEHRAQLKPWADRWIANALSTRRIGDDWPEVVECVYGLYKAADLEMPHNVVRCDGPVTGAAAACFASTVWYLREHPEEERDAFGKNLDDSFRIAVAMTACHTVIKNLIGDQKKALRVMKKTFLEAVQIPDAPQIKESPRQKHKDLEQMFLKSTTHWRRMRQEGAMWSGWPAHLSFFRHIVKLDIDYTNWHPYERLAELSGYRYVHHRFCIVTERPLKIGMDQDNRPHCADGPSHVWDDGAVRYYWHGTNIPQEWIENPESLTPAIALGQENAELRQCACDILTWAKILETLKARTINEHSDPQIGRLVEVDLPEAPNQRFLVARCGTGRTVAIPVSQEVKTAIEAQQEIYPWLPIEAFTNRQHRA